MSDAYPVDGPTVDDLYALYAGHATTLAALRQALGDRPIEAATTGQLAALLARLPSDTRLAVDEYVRIDPALDEGRTESRTAVAVTVQTLFADTPIEAVNAHGTADVYGAPVAGVVLGAVCVA